MKISELSAITKTPSSTLRYYEKIKLLPAINRQGGQRNYDQNIIWRISFINAAKSTGFSLEEISDFLRITESDHQWRPAVEAKISELNEKINQFQKMSAALTHVLENGCLDQGPEVFGRPEKQLII